MRDDDNDRWDMKNVRWKLRGERWVIVDRLEKRDENWEM